VLTRSLPLISASWLVHLGRSIAIGSIHRAKVRTAHGTSSFAKAPIFAKKLRPGETAGHGIARRKVMGGGNLMTMANSLHSPNSNHEVALGSPPQSLGEDAQVEWQETPRKPRKRLRLTRLSG